MASLRVPYRIVIWNGSTLHFYLRSPGPLRPTYLSFIPTIYGGTPLIPGSLAILCYLLSFRRAGSPSSNSWSDLLFFKFGMACRSRSRGEKGGRRTTWGCVLGASFELPHLFLLASRPFKPGLFFWSISSSSSSDSESNQVITNCFGWTKERLADSVSKSEISTGF